VALIVNSVSELLRTRTYSRYFNYDFEFNTEQELSYKDRRPIIGQSIRGCAQSALPIYANELMLILRADHIANWTDVLTPKGDIWTTSRRKRARLKNGIRLTGSQG
jgi:hypothetical protein